MLHGSSDALTNRRDCQWRNLVVAVMTSALFHCMEAYFNNFRGTKYTQLACNEDGVIDKRSIFNLQGLHCSLQLCKNIFKKFDDSCEKGNETVMQIHERSICL